MLIGQITPAIFQESIRRTPNHKAASPDGVPCLVLKHMPTAFHEALQLNFQALVITEITPPLCSRAIQFSSIRSEIRRDLIRRLAASDKGYDFASCGLKLASPWYAGDGTLVTNSVEDMICLTDIVQHFSTWSNIHLNVAKCKIIAYINDLKSIPRRRNRDGAVRARFATVTLSSCPIGFLTQDKPLPGGYLGASLTASLSPEAHLL
jgi:hypothetical protein